jgi:hypothetical protein
VKRVGIGEEDEIGLGGARALMAGPRLTEPTRWQGLTVQDPDTAGIPRRNGARTDARSVRGPIVHDQDRKVGILLRGQGFEARRDISRFVARRNDDGDGGEREDRRVARGRRRQKRPRFPKSEDKSQEDENPGEIPYDRQPLHR